MEAGDIYQIKLVLTSLSKSTEEINHVNISLSLEQRRRRQHVIVS